MLLGDAATSCALAMVVGAAGLLLLRTLYYGLMYEPTRRYLRRRGRGFEASLPVVVEETWEGLGSLLILSLCSSALWAGHNKRCDLADTSGCLHGWPFHEHAWTIDALFLLALAWYAQGACKHWFGLGRIQGLDVALHHAFTLSLLVMAYTLELLRVGVLAFWLFTVATPLLSLSKVLHCLDVRPAKKLVFLLYAAACLATRVVLVPAVLLRCTLGSARSAQLPRGVVYGGNMCLLVVYGIQLFWFGRLVGIWVTGKLDEARRPVIVLQARGRKSA